VSELCLLFKIWVRRFLSSSHIILLNSCPHRCVAANDGFYHYLSTMENTTAFIGKIYQLFRKLWIK
jgi:hypothetical protein